MSPRPSPWSSPPSPPVGASPFCCRASASSRVRALPACLRVRAFSGCRGALRPRSALLPGPPRRAAPALVARRRAGRRCGRAASGSSSRRACARRRLGFAPVLRLVPGRCRATRSVLGSGGRRRGCSPGSTARRRFLATGRGAASGRWGGAGAAGAGAEVTDDAASRVRLGRDLGQGAPASAASSIATAGCAGAGPRPAICRRWRRGWAAGPGRGRAGGAKRGSAPQAAAGHGAGSARPLPYRWREARLAARRAAPGWSRALSRADPGGC